MGVKMTPPSTEKSKKKKGSKFWEEYWRNYYEKRFKRMESVRVTDFERLSNTVDSRLQFTGNYIVSLIFDEGLPTQQKVTVFIDDKGKATIDNLLDTTVTRTEIYNSPVSERFERK